jgi:hypothetical protein
MKGAKKYFSPQNQIEIQQERLARVGFAPVVQQREELVTRETREQLEMVRRDWREEVMVQSGAAGEGQEGSEEEEGGEEMVDVYWQLSMDVSGYYICFNIIFRRIGSFARVSPCSMFSANISAYSHFGFKDNF